MFKARLLTAMVLAPLALFAVFGLALTPFIILLDIALLIAAWEWSNLSGYERIHQKLIYVALLAVCLLVLQASLAMLPITAFLLVGLLFWLVCFYWAIRYPYAAAWADRWRRALIGFLVLVPCWVAMVTLKQHPQANTWLLCLLLIVWGADVGAYAAGKQLGRVKLAPKISPGKTREGLFGGLLVCALVGLGFAVWLELNLISAISLIVLSVCTGLMSVLGDLFESMLKRYRGVKDSSHILPGHGGVLDRIDSLTAAAPFFVLCLLYLLPG